MRTGVYLGSDTGGGFEARVVTGDRVAPSSVSGLWCRRLGQICIFSCACGGGGGGGKGVDVSVCVFLGTKVLMDICV